MSRPNHLTVIDEVGMTKSMPASKDQFEWHVNTNKEDAPLIFLGLGPEPHKLFDWFGLSSTDPIFFIECQDFVDQAGDDWAHRIPDNFERLAADRFTVEMAANSHVVRYLPAQRAFPSCYDIQTARLTLKNGIPSSKDKTVWLPCLENDLLCKELAIAFAAKGYQVAFLDPEPLGKHPGNVLPELLAQGVPELFFSVNFKGLDHYGVGASILEEAGVKVAVWMVDNPFNLLTSVKSNYWKRLKYFVTDHTFIGPLIDNGAKWVTHLPLAACPELFSEGGTLPDYGQDLEGKLVFVGRSEFPKKDKFFAGLTPNKRLLDEAIVMLLNGDRPHFHWWQDHVLAQLWPGNEIRHVGIGAEVAGYAWRVRCLAAAGKDAIIFGDDKWGQIEDITAEVRPLLDYYTHLPAVYRSAGVSLNVTGMQLPAGLTQRHFDVWCAGGFLITDANPGMKIFPEDMSDAITFASSDDIPALFEQYRDETDEKAALRTAWQELIRNDHTYHNRVVTVLKTLGMEWTWDIP